MTQKLKDALELERAWDDKQAARRLAEIEPQFDDLKAENERLRAVLERSITKHKAYVGICNGDKELVDAIIPMIEKALKCGADEKKGGSGYDAKNV